MLLDPADAQSIVAGQHLDPYSVLGMHFVDGKLRVCAHIPNATEIDVLDAKSGKPVARLDAEPPAAPSWRFFME